MFKVGHLSDIHLDKKNKNVVEASLDFAFEKFRDHGVSAILISGDTYNGSLPLGNDSPLLKMIERVEWSSAPIYIIQGTPSHDIPGAIRIFNHIRSGFGQYFYVYEKPESFDVGRHPVSDFSNGMLYPQDEIDEQLLPSGHISVLPAISKGILAGNNPGLSPAELNELARDRMRDILKGFALKAENKKPHILIMHYAIEGCVYSSGQEQCGNEIVLSIQDLELANADYIAAGHIHNAFQPNLPDWISYAGSLIHNKADEQEPKGFKIVTFDDSGKLANIEFIESPSIPIQTVDIYIENGSYVFPESINEKAKLRIRVNGPDSDLTEDIMSQIKNEADNINENNIVVKIPTIETKSTVPDYKTDDPLIEKVKKYCEARGIIFNDSMAEKITLLEETTGRTKKMHVPVAGGMEITYLKVRGAIGLKYYGEEVEIDFSQFNEGYIAFCGVNGAGKTTLLENCHPWPKLVSRAGSLRHHFYLKDSMRELRFKYNEKEYTARILITPGDKGKIEGYLYEGDRLVNENGTLAGYEEELEKVLCSPEIFFKLIFQSQESDNLAGMTATPLKNFFNQLFGLDLYPLYHGAGKNYRTDILTSIEKSITKIEEISTTISNFESKITDKNIIMENRSIAEININDKKQEINDIEKSVKELQEIAGRAEKLSVDLARIELDYKNESQQFAELMSKKSDSIKTISAKINSLSSDIEGINSRLEIAPRFLKYSEDLTAITKQRNDHLAELNDLEAEALIISNKISELENSKTNKTDAAEQKIQAINKQLTAEKNSIENLQNKLLEADEVKKAVEKLKTLQSDVEALNKQLQEKKELELKLESAKIKLEMAKKNRENQLKTLNDKIDLHNKQVKILDGVPCLNNSQYTSTCKFIKGAAASKELLAKLLNEKVELIKANDKPLAESKAIETLNATIAALKYDDNSHLKVKKLLEKIKAKNPEAILNEINNAEAILGEKHKLIDNLNDRINEVADELTSEIQGIDDELDVHSALLSSNIEAQTTVSDLTSIIKKEIDEFIKQGYDATEMADTFWKNSNCRIDDGISFDPQMIKTNIEKLQFTLKEKSESLKSTEESKLEIEKSYDEKLQALIKSTNELAPEIEAKKQELKDLTGGKDIGESDINELGEERIFLIDQLQGLKEEVIKYNEQLKLIESLELELRENRNRLIAENKNRETLNNDSSDWHRLINIFGRNGLQAVELTAACPKISNIATNLIRFFGKDWAINVRPLKESADHSKELDDFTIIVSTEGGPKEFNKFSPGEKVWIEQSIRKAGIIYIINSTGYSFRTLIQDEADGALNEESAYAFLATAKRSHELTNAYHTLIVSHRPSIIEAVEQKIKFLPDKGRIEFEYV